MAHVIEVHDLVKVYPGDITAVDGISFAVEAGEFFGFLGPNGAGKTTTIKLLITLLRKTRGEVHLFGLNLDQEAQAIRAAIGYAAQEVGVDDDLTARENLNLQGRLYHLGSSERRRRVDELLDLMDLSSEADRSAGSYSGGMRKRLDLATALMHQPRILFLDEPTTGLDPQNRSNLWVYLERLNQQEQLTIFLTTHYMEEADKLCNRLAIIDHGRIKAMGSPAHLKQELGGDVITLNFQDGGQTSDEQCARAQELLTNASFVHHIACFEGGVNIYAPDGNTAVSEVLHTLEAGGLKVTKLSLTSPSLDDVFLRHTGYKIRDEAPNQNWRSSRFYGSRRRR